MSIYIKLSKIQNKLKAPKGQYNSFGKYKYRNCEDILEAVKPLCLEEEVTLMLTDSIELIGERYYVKATAILVSGEETITVAGYAREEESKKGMDASQVTGASSSYARKYALNGLFNIDDTKDSDSTNTHGKDDSKPLQAETNAEGKARTQAENKVIDSSKLALLKKEMERTGVVEHQINTLCKISSLTEMKTIDWDKMMKKLVATKTKPVEQVNE